MRSESRLSGGVSGSGLPAPDRTESIGRAEVQVLFGLIKLESKILRAISHS